MKEKEIDKTELYEIVQNCIDNILYQIKDYEYKQKTNKRISNSEYITYLANVDTLLKLDRWLNCK